MKSGIAYTPPNITGERKTRPGGQFGGATLLARQMALLMACQPNHCSHLSSPQTKWITSGELNYPVVAALLNCIDNIQNEIHDLALGLKKKNKEL